MNKKRKEFKKNNKIIEKRINKINTIIEYLIDSYYLEPNRKIDKFEIYNKFNNGDEILIDLFLSELRNKKKIIGKSKFIITFDGVLYLEDLIRTRNGYRNNKIAIVLSLGAFAISILAIYDDSLSKFVSIFLGFTIIFMINKLIPKKKK